MAVEKIILDIQAQVGKAKKDINSLKTTTKGLNKEVNQTAKLMKKAGTAMLAFASVGLVTKALKDMIALNVEFEKTLTNVLTLLDAATRARFGDFLSAGAMRTMTQFGLQVNDVNKALFDTISAGIKAGDSIRFLNEAAKLAVGGVTSLSTAVDGMTSIMNAYSLSIEDANKVASAFFTAQKFGKTTVDELANSIGMVAPIAKAAGISYQEMLAALALLTTVGLQTDIATTALRATISSLINTTTESEIAFHKMGIETGITALKANGLGKTLLQIAKATKENQDILTQFIPNVRALTAVAALGEEALFKYDKILLEVKTDTGEFGSLAQATTAQMATLAKQGDVVTAMWGRIKIELVENVKQSVKFRTALASILILLELGKGKEEEAPPPADGGFLGSTFFGGQKGLKVFEKSVVLIKDWAKAMEAFTKEQEKMLVAIAPDVPGGTLVEQLFGDSAEIESFTQQFFTLLGDMQRDVIDNEKNTQKELLNIRQVSADKSTEIEVQRISKNLDLVQGAFGLARGLAGESFLVQQLVAIAESLVSTFLSGQLAYASQVGIPVVGPVLAAAAKTNAIRQGLVNTAIIAGVTIGGLAAGFKEGGFTGTSKIPLRDKDGPITGWTHEDEFVFNKDKTRTLRPLFEDIHNNRIDIHGLAALTRRGVMKTTTKLNADILEQEVKKIYRKISEHRPERASYIYTDHGYTKTIGNTTINVST